MLEDVLDILVGDSFWRGALSQLLTSVNTIFPDWDERRLGLELRQLVGFKIESKRMRTDAGVIRVVEIHRNPDHPDQQIGDPGSSVRFDPDQENDPGSDPGCDENDPGSGQGDPGRDPGQSTPDPGGSEPVTGYVTGLLENAFIERLVNNNFRAEVPRALHVLHPETRFEIRCLNPIKSGVFDDIDKAAKAVVGSNGKHKGIYFTLNPVNRPVTNRLEKTKDTTNAGQIERRQWLLIDIEGTRENAKGQNASNAEVIEAIRVAEKISQSLDPGCQPLALCSGNGCHLLYRIDLPNTEAETALVNRALKGLAALFDTNGATIDTKVSDPSRISKLPGTLTRKGEHTPERPQRHAFVLDWEVTGVLPRQMLETWARHAPAEESTKSATKSVANKKPRLDAMERARLWLEKRDPAIEGQHGDEQLFKTCCELLVGFDLSEGDAFDLLSEWNQRNVPPFSDKELWVKLKNAAKNAHQERGGKLAQGPVWSEEEAGRDEQLNNYAWTDLGNARALLHLYGPKLRWCTTSAKWFVWTGTHWKDDGKNKALAYANKTAIARLAASEELEDAEMREKAAKYFKGCQNTKQRNSCLEQVKAWAPNVVTTDELDRDHWLLNCKNGTLNLRTGELKKHDQADLITRCAATNFVADAECPLWLKFLARVTDNNEELIAYLRRAVGYSLTGDTREQCLFMCYGGGKNGKSVFLEVLGHILAGFSTQSPASTFAAGDKDKIPNDVARLKGARLVRCVETDEKLVFNEGLVKQMTGSDTLTARFLRAEWFEFRPAFKLWFATNHKPSVHGSDNGIWRRMRLIPWNVQIPTEEIDMDLQSKLIKEAEGILAWAYRGCMEWQATGLDEPDLVRKETDEYREEMDVIGQWVSECCDTGPLLREKTGLLYKYFGMWAKEKGIWSGNEVHFGRRLGAKGFQAYKGTNGIRERLGLRINLRTRKDEDAEPDPILDKAVQEVVEGFNL